MIGGRSLPGRLRALARLLLLPDPRQLADIGGESLILEHVGMTPNQLVVNAARHGGEVEPTLLLRHAGMKRYLEEEIAELVAQLLRLPPLDGIRHLVGLLDGVGRDGAEGLLAIPRTAVLRVAQASHQLEERSHRLPGLAASAHGAPSVHTR